MKLLSTEVQKDLTKILASKLGEGELIVSEGSDALTVSVLVGKMVFAEIRVESERWGGDAHWEVHQRVALWNHSVSAHNVELVAKLLLSVGDRVRSAETAAIEFMENIPGARVSSEFSPVEI
jgi:hypothetical protein